MGSDINLIEELVICGLEEVQFKSNKVLFLSYTISAYESHVDEEKVRAIRD